MVENVIIKEVGTVLSIICPKIQKLLKIPENLEQVRVKYTKLCTCILFSLKENDVINMSYYEVSVKNDEKWHISP